MLVPVDDPRCRWTVAWWCPWDDWTLLDFLTLGWWGQRRVQKQGYTEYHEAWAWARAVVWEGATALLCREVPRSTFGRPTAPPPVGMLGRPVDPPPCR